MDKYVILTGGTGFIGSHLLEKLLNNDKKVILIKRSFSDTWRINDLLDSSNLILFNSDSEKISDIFYNYDIEGIFHLATFYKKFHENKDIPIMFDSNLKFPTFLLDCAMNSNIKYFINTGTFFEYSQDKLPITENSANKSFNLYASTKLAFEDVLKYYNNEFNLNIATLKLFTPFGPKDDENKLIPYLILNGLKNNEVKLNNPNQIMDLVFVKDIVDAFILSSKNYDTFENYSKFNISTGITYEINEIYNLINSSINNLDYDVKKSKISLSSSKNVNNVLGWKSKTSLKNGLNFTIDYYREKYDL